MAEQQETCEVFDPSIYDVSFEEARDAYASQKFWVSFFIRPCCPPPGAKTAQKQIEAQREMVRAREDLSDAQKAELIELIDKGEAWYASTPYWTKGN